MKQGKWIKIVRVSERAVWVPDGEMPKLRDRLHLNNELDKAGGTSTEYHLVDMTTGKEVQP